MTEEEARLWGVIEELEATLEARERSISETIGMYEDKLQKSNARERHYKNQASNAHDEIKKLKRILWKKNKYIKNNQKQKPKFKNGKRGTYLNGG